eukprot:gene2224-1387_t
MFNGFPSLPIAPPAVPIDASFQETCSNWTVVPPANQVRLSYPAICHLLHLSKTPSVRYGVFGRLYGAQLHDNTIEVGNVCMNPPRERVMDRETDEERRRRQEEEHQRQMTAFSRYEELYHSELLDSYQVGIFVICSATFNPFTSFVMNQLTDLVTSSQPCVLVMYDPFRTALLGRPYLRAFTLTESYVNYITTLREKRAAKENKLLKECGVTRNGVLREIPVQIDVDPYHQLGLEHVDVEPTIDSFTAIQSDAVSNYIEALLSNIQENTMKLTKQLDNEAKQLEKDHSGNNSVMQPLGQSVEVQLGLFALKEQTQHLEALCDSALVNLSILRDL